MKTYALLLALLAPHCTDGFAPVHQPATMPATCSQLSADSNNSIDNEGSVLRQLQQTGLAVAFSMAIFAAPAFGADFAGKDISGQDFSGQDLAGKDFSSAIAKGTNFKGANLQGASFQKANLVNCDFTGADLANTNYVDAVLDGSVFKDVTAQKSTWSASILDIKVRIVLYFFYFVDLWIY